MQCIQNYTLKWQLVIIQLGLMAYQYLAQTLELPQF